MCGNTAIAAAEIARVKPALSALGSALKALGLETHVVEFAPVLMAEQLDGQGGQLRQITAPVASRFPLKRAFQRLKAADPARIFRDIGLQRADKRFLPDSLALNMVANHAKRLDRI